MTLALAAAEIIGTLVLVTGLSALAIGWVDRRSADITAERSRVNSSVQSVVTTTAFAVVYVTYRDSIPGALVATGIAALFGLALGGEIQAERLARSVAR